MKKTVVFLLFLAIWACGSDSNGDDTPQADPVLTSLVLTSSNGRQLDLFGTNTSTISVTGRDQFGDNIAITGTVNWSANNGNLTVNSAGEVTAVSVGSSVVTASIGNISRNLSFTIIDSEPQTGTFIYVSDAVEFTTGPWKILRFDENGNNGTTFIDDDLAWPQDIVFLENSGQVLISNLSSNKINRYDANTGNLIGAFATGINGPTRMKIGPNNLLYVLQWGGNGLVRRYQLDGTFVDEFTNVGVARSIGLDWDSSGNLYVSSFEGASIRKFDTNGNDMGLFVNSDVEGPTNIWFDDSDNLFVNDWTGNKVVQFDADGDFVRNLISTGINQPEGVDFFPNGNFLIGSGGTSEVRMYDADGVFLENLVTSGSAGLVQPNAVRIRVVN